MESADGGHRQMSPQKYKDLEIGGRKFRVGLVSAFRGAWIFAQIQLGRIGDPEVFRITQDYLLSACSLYRRNPDGTETPMQIYEPQRWLLPEAQEFEYDLVLVQKLSEAAMEFNLGPLLKDRATPPA